MALFAVNKLVTYQALDVLTMLGFIILIGIVVNNAILLVHQSLLDMRTEKLPPQITHSHRGHRRGDTKARPADLHVHGDECLRHASPWCCFRERDRSCTAGSGAWSCPAVSLFRRSLR